MDIEEALNVEPGDKLIFDPQNSKKLITRSALVTNGFLTLYPEQEVIVSSVIAYKEFLRKDKQTSNLQFLDQLLYKTDRFQNEKNIDLLYFEIEDSTTAFPMQLFNFPVYEKFSRYNSLEELVEFMESGGFEFSDFMGALVDENLYDVEMRDYISLLYLGKQLAIPSIDEISRNKEQLISILEQKFQEGLVNEEDIERAEDLDVQEAYRTQLNANRELMNFYNKTAQFCDGIISIDKGVITYADFVSSLSRGFIKPKIINFFFEEGYILKKEFLGYIVTGYDKLT